jgi:hypothetical protein
VALDVKGKLFSSTADGGTGYCLGGSGCGTVYSMTTTGKKEILHDFTGRPDGALGANLTLVKGLFYGTSPGGGEYGFGTFFTLKP